MGCAQKIKISATSQSWSGGVCCKTGTNYQIILTGKSNLFKNVDATSVCIDGRKFKKELLIIKKSESNNYSTIIIYCGFSQNENDNLSEANNKVIYEKCSEANVMLTSLSKKQIIKIDLIQVLPYLAYP